MFLAAVKSGQIPRGSYLLIESLDRLTRQRLLPSLTLFLDLIHAGINIVTLADGKVFGSDVDQMQLIMSILVMTRAHEELEIKSFRLSKAWEHKRAQAGTRKLTGVCPAWLRLDTATSSFNIIKDRAAVVLKIFEWSAAGAGSFLIVRRLNRDRVPTFRGRSGWSTSSVTKILSNRAVLGELQPHKMVDGKRHPVGEPIAQYFPKIVEDDLFVRVQAARSKRAVAGGGRRGKAQRNLFTHLATCQRCGAPMHLQNRGVEPKGGLSIRCSRSIKGAGCDAGGWRYKEFETVFLRYLRDHGIADVLKSDANPDTKRLADEIEGKELQLENLLLKRNQTFELAGAEELGTAFFRTKLAEMEAGVRSLRAELGELHRSQLDMEEPTLDRSKEGLFEGLAGDTPAVEEQRVRLAARIRTFIRRLTLDPGRTSKGILVPILRSNAKGQLEARVATTVGETSSSFTVSWRMAECDRSWSVMESATAVWTSMYPARAPTCVLPLSGLACVNIAQTSTSMHRVVGHVGFGRIPPAMPPVHSMCHSNPEHELKDLRVKGSATPPSSSLWRKINDGTVAL